MAASDTIALSGLARQLVQAGLLNEKDALVAYKEAKGNKIPLVRHLVNNAIVDARAISLIASHEFGVPVFDLSSFDTESIPMDIVSEKLIRKHHALPLYKRGNRLFIAISDPTNADALEEIRFNTGITTDSVLVEDDKLSSLIDKVLEAKDSASLDSQFDDADLDNLDIETVEDQADSDVDTSGDDAPIVRFVNKILLDSIKKGASDLHFEPYEKSFRVRFRIDGVLQEVAAPPNNLASRISARLKVMSKLNIAERRVPQDGRVKMKLSKNKSIDFRVSTLPTLYGEKIVMRILDSESAKMGIEMLGYEPAQRKLYEEALGNPQGMILVTGPTGSGKTVSLYTGVNILNTPETNISTAEDPVEINLAGVNQVQINTATGLNFSVALRAFLRQDPDVILVGEIRDLETAEIAMKAAQTGHLVLSTLHTNSAPETLTRMVNMGVAAFNIATTVRLVIAQRLARRLCKACKVVADIPDKALIEQGFKKEEIKDLTIYEPVGCDKCVKGYKGRVGVYQVMPISKAIGRIIMEGGNSLQISDQATKDGVADLRESALEKARQGVTSLAEVQRVTAD
jgi:type IV pilus assembly protein PilB